MWKKFKAWVAKNKAWLVAIGSSFVAGLALAFGFTGRRDARIVEHLTRLEQRLAEYEALNSRLGELNADFAERLAGLQGSNSGLRAENAELRALGKQVERDIVATREDLARARQSITSSQLTADQLSDIGRQLQAKSASIDDGIARLARFVEKYGAQK